MDIELLRDFSIYVRTKSLTKTAEIVHVSPSAISRHITALETDMGAPLFEDRAAGTLSEAGEAVLEAASQIVDTYDRMGARVRSLKNNGGRALKVAYLPIDTEVADAAVSAKTIALSLNPPCPVRLIQPTDSSLYDMLIRGTADIVISPLTNAFRNNMFDRRLVVPSPAYASLRLELGISGAEISLKNLSGLTVLYQLHPPYRDYCDWVLDMLENHHVAANVRYAVNASIDEAMANESVDKILMYTRGASGIRVPATSSSAPRRKLYRITDEDVNGDWYAIWRKDSQSPLLSGFVDVLAQEGASVAEEASQLV